MQEVKVTEAHCVRVFNMAQRYEADVLILDGKIVRIIYHEIPGIGRQCMIRENQDLWFDDLLLEENGKVRYEPQNSATKYLYCDLHRCSEGEFEFDSKKAISMSHDSTLREFYEHLSDGLLKDYVRKEHEERIEKVKKELEELQAW